MAAEALGTMLLLATVVGSGIMADRLSGGNAALALLANSFATGAGLVALILAFASTSGAHLNPAVTLSEALNRRFAWRHVPGYLGAQIGGAFVGVAAADAMFGEPIFAFSSRARSGPGLIFGEVVATVGLLVVVRGASRGRTLAVSVAAGAYIAAAYWFTSSTYFANPAVTLARTATNTFAGIRARDAPGFVAAELIGAVAGAFLTGRLFGGTAERSD